MKAIVILSHLMDCAGELGDESKERVNLAIETFRKKNNVDLILTIGWAYREDIDLPIGLAVRKYLLSKGIKDHLIKTDINSRDTVGDAIFSKINLVDIYDIDQLFVVTSDYHVLRAQQIFESVMSIDIEVLGCNTSHLSNPKSSEADSLLAFRKTFEHTNFQSNDCLLETLRNNHPFYNGEIYNKIDKHPLPLLQTLQQ